jgi:hypothetical protein
MIGRLHAINGAKDVLAGVIFIAIGVAVFFLAQQYEIGTATRMGPGYFPALLGIVLAGLGATTFIRGIRAAAPDPIPVHRLEPLVLIFAGILAFSLLIGRAGLVVAAAVLIALACFRRLLSNPAEVLLTYLVLVSFAAGVFIYWFGMPIPVFWWDH